MVKIRWIKKRGKNNKAAAKQTLRSGNKRKVPKKQRRF
jgi:hypothetical protein